MNEKFNENAKVEKLTKKVGRGVRLIVIGPLENKILQNIWLDFLFWLFISKKLYKKQV